jgi:hypothetical protein
MAKLQNIKAIREMIDGNHWTQTRTKVGFTDTEATSQQNKKREVGEIWEEYDQYGNVVCVWEQKKGYRVRSGVLKDEVQAIRDYLNAYPNCYEDCKTTEFTKLDQRFRAKFGRCADCQFRYETKLKIDGKYEEYEKQQMLANAEAFFRAADIEIEAVSDQLAGELHYANSDGNMEKWSGDTGMAEKVKEEYYKYKEIALKTLNGEPIDDGQ